MPFYDRQTTFRNRKEAIREVAKLKILPEPYEGPWERPNSDEGLSRLFFSSTGQFVIAKDEETGGYVSDTTYLLKYKHRPGNDFMQYGCKVYFDKDGKVTKIQDAEENTYFPNGAHIDKYGATITEEPGKDYWEWAKQLARSTGFAATAILHLSHPHLTWGNYPGAALRMFLPPDHPIRKVFFIHFWKTSNTVLRARGFLFDKLGLLLRSTSWDFKTGLEPFFKDLLTTDFKFETFPEFVERNGMSDCEFYVSGKDGVELHEAITKYASGYIDTVYTSEEQLQADAAMKKCHEYLVKKLQIPNSEYTLDNVKLIWGEIIFRVTGYHSSVGQVTGIQDDPTFANLRIQKKEIESLVATRESALAIALIGGVTTVTCPTLSQDWSHLFDDEIPECYHVLRKDLFDLEMRINERNKDRPTNIDYHPRYCPISICG